MFSSAIFKVLFRSDFFISCKCKIKPREIDRSRERMLYRTLKVHSETLKVHSETPKVNSAAIENREKPREIESSVLLVIVPIPLFNFRFLIYSPTDSSECIPIKFWAPLFHIFSYLAHNIWIYLSFPNACRSAKLLPNPAGYSSVFFRRFPPDLQWPRFDSRMISRKPSYLNDQAIDVVRRLFGARGFPSYITTDRNN